MALVVKDLPASAGDSGGGKMPWRSKWQPTPVFLPGESPGQRSLICIGQHVHGSMNIQYICVNVKICMYISVSLNMLVTATCSLSYNQGDLHCVL